MATIKSYSDLQQSKKLAKILPLDSADMCYMYLGTEDKEYEDIPICAPAMEGDLCAWSLAALLKTLNFPSLTQNKEDEWEVCVFDHDNDDYIEKTASNPVDTCYEMVIRLHELNLL